MILRNKNQKILAHYSTAPVHVFNKDCGTLNTNTQGYVYAIDFTPGVRSCTTLRFEPKTLLIFKGEAVTKFKHCPALSSRLFGWYHNQYQTTHVGDVRWKKENAERHNNILVINDIEILTIEDKERESKVTKRRFITNAVTLYAIIATLIFFASVLKIIIDNWNYPSILLHHLIPPTITITGLSLLYVLSMEYAKLKAADHLKYKAFENDLRNLDLTK